MHERFHYKTLLEVKDKCRELSVDLPFAENTSALAAALDINGFHVPNILGIAPMEVAHATKEVKPI